MGRQREFDVKQTLHQCMDVFWEKGYQATCFDDLTETTGVKKQSLYGAFDNKRALFLKALALYRDQSCSRLEELALQQDADPLHQLGAVRDLVLGSGDDSCKGCLMINTALEFGNKDAEVLHEVEIMFAETERSLETIIRRGQEHQRITRHHTAQALAAHLTNVLRGAQVMKKTGAPQHQISAILTTAFALLAP
ncbi:TetR/AcrR family transcriptional regulator [Paenibacillus sp. 1P07SE]|uniref:TetR/AcrR family transcriptional regulator n=1 Tax=Paenibacillus sp. 1P07SE TaxID=3132209 RepID=UPI0039A4AA79